MSAGLFEKPLLDKVEPSESLSSGMRWGFICIGFFLSLAFAYFANSARLPALETLSRHEITPVNFGMMQLSFKNKQNTDTALPSKDLGYVYVVRSQSLPNRYDKPSPPELTEIAGSISPNTKDLRFHDALNITNADAIQLSLLVGQPMTVWFYQGKIAALSVSNQFVISHERMNAGIRDEVQWQWVVSGLSLLLAMILLVYPKLIQLVPSHRRHIRNSS